MKWIPIGLMWLLLIVTMLGAHVGRAQGSIAHSDELDDLRVDVGYLSADVLEGRETGTMGEAIAARYIARRFEEIGLTPGIGDAWFQDFEFRYSTNPHAPAGNGESRIGRNVVGFLDQGAERTIVIGAHYDHLGYGSLGSRQPGDSLIHNGADDNASGVAALIEIASRLRSSGATQNNYLVVAFSGEELGLYGSKHFVRAASIGGINYMINLDMVGRLGEDRTLAVNGTGTSPSWDAALDAAATKMELTLAKHASGLGPSDHSSFYLENIPVLHLFTGQHADYHKPTDDSHRIDYNGLADVATFALEVIKVLDDEGALVFLKTADEDQDRQIAFTVSLGIMPDYVFDGDGVRIDAVLDGRAADRAGLARGDILIRLGEIEIEDIYTYMEALAGFESGDATTVAVRRGEDVLEKEIRF